MNTLTINTAKVGMKVTPHEPKNWAYGMWLTITDLVPNGVGGVEGRVLCGVGSSPVLRSSFIPSQLIELGEAYWPVVPNLLD